jgi:hypothetical protein
MMAPSLAINTESDARIFPSSGVLDHLADRRHLLGKFDKLFDRKGGAKPWRMFRGSLLCLRL